MTDIILVPEFPDDVPRLGDVWTLDNEIDVILEIIL